MHVLGFALLVLLSLADSAYAETLQAQVVDARTGQPIAGAVVLGLWSSGGEMEVETDMQGRFTIVKPQGVSQGKELVAVYKFGYVVWLNTDVFDPRDDSGFFRPRPDTRVPSQIRLEPFPPNGNRARHVVVLSWIAEPEGRKDRPTRFWSAIQQEIKAAWDQCGKSCE
jgi:hypothetical protein